MLAFPVLVLVAALVGGCLLVVWLIVRHPRLSASIAVYIGLVAWLGAHDAQALAIYALIVLAIWRLAHRHSFQRLVGRRSRSPSRRSWARDPPLARDQRAVRSGEALPAAPAHPEDSTDRIRTVG